MTSTNGYVMAVLVHWPIRRCNIMTTAGKDKLSPREKYRKLTEKLRKGVPPTTNPLDFYWRVGRSADRLGEPSYGEALIDGFAQDIGMGKTLVYGCMKLYAFWPKAADLKDLITKGVKWTHIRSLVHRKLTPDDRESLVDYIEKEEPSAREVKAKTRELLRAKEQRAASSRGTQSLSAVGRLTRRKVARSLMDVQ